MLIYGIMNNKPIRWDYEYGIIYGLMEYKWINNWNDSYYYGDDE